MVSETINSADPSYSYTGLVLPTPVWLFCNVQGALISVVLDRFWKKIFKLSRLKNVLCNKFAFVKLCKYFYPKKIWENDPKTSVTTRSFLHHVWIVFVSCLDRFGIKFGSFLHHVCIVFASCLDRFCIMFGSFLCIFC